MKPTFLLLLFICFWSPQLSSAQNSDIVNDLATYIKSGNTRDVARYFASTVEFNLLNEENVYSKVQAESVLKDFLNKHVPVSAEIIHRLDSNPNYRFAVIQLKTENGNFRTTISLKDTGGQFLITEIRIELDKS